MRKALLILLCFVSFKLYAQPAQTFSQRFNGDQVFLSSSNSTLNLGNSFTIESWIYLNEASPYAVIAGKVANPRETDPFQNYILAFNETGLKPEFVQTTGATGSYRTATSPTPIALNTWTHLAVSLGNGSMKLFINGIEVASQTSPGIPTPNPGVPFSIGAGASPTFQTRCCGVKGAIKQVRVWNTARTAVEIQNSMNVNLSGAEANLLACYPMNESSGQILDDISPNNNDLIRGVTMNAEIQDPTPITENSLKPYFSYKVIELPPVAGSSFYEELYPIDYDDDSYTDLLISTVRFPPTNPPTFAPLLAFKNNNDLNFSSANPFQSTVSVIDPNDFTVGDFNKDGREDLFIAEQGTDMDPYPGDKNKLLLQNSSGQLVDSPGNIPSQIDFTHNTSNGDIDNDGDLDIFVCNIYNQSRIGPYFLINNGTGSFTTQSSNLPQNIANLTNEYMSSRFADIDKDGDLDLILGAKQGNTIDRDLILLNNGSGTFTQGTPLPVRYGNSNWGTVAIVVADFNNDTWPDLLMSTVFKYQTCYLQLFLNNKNGSFSDVTSNIPQTWPTTNTWIKQIETGDFNNDGTIDFVLSTFSGSNPIIYFNNGKAEFTPEETILNLPGENVIMNIRVRDYDNDGQLEIAVLDLNNRLIIAKRTQDYILSIPSYSGRNNTNISVYPNPFKDKLSILLPANEYIKESKIRNIQGLEIYKSGATMDEKLLGSLPAGIYILTIETNRNHYSKKIVKD